MGKGVALRVDEIRHIRPRAPRVVQVIEHRRVDARVGRQFDVQDRHRRGVDEFVGRAQLAATDDAQTCAAVVHALVAVASVKV